MKRDIFYNLSVLSSWALRPMVPFAVFEKCPEKPARSTLPLITEPGLCFQTVSNMDDQLYLESRQAAALCKSILELPVFSEADKISGQTAGGFSAVPGIHLLDSREEGAAEAAESIKVKAAGLEKSVLTWRSCSLSLFEAELSDDLWWTRISLEQLWELPLSSARSC